jgi:methionyl-tRNA formyltransferase
MQRIIFAGTTEFGIPTLEKLRKNYELVLVITQPDKPTGRDKKLTPPPMKVWAEKNHIQVLQPTKILDDKSKILSFEPDLLLVAAYGQIIPKEILEIPKFGSVNIHGSVLPKYRGATPIQTALLNGDPNTGITLIKMDEKMDHGDILGIRTIPLTGKETFIEAYKTLAQTAADLTDDVLPNWFAGTLKPQPQIHNEATFTKIFTREDGKINWARPAIEIYNQIRALNPEPGTWTKLNDKVIKILEAEVLADHKIDLPGKLYVSGEGLAVKTLDGSLVLKRIKPEGKNEMTGKDFLNGLKSLSDKLFI